MRRWAKSALGVVVLLVVLVLVAAAAVPYVVDTPRIQAYIASSAAQALGRPVKFASVSLRVKEKSFGNDPRRVRYRHRYRCW